MAAIPLTLIDACVTIICLSVSFLLYERQGKRAILSQGYILENRVTHARLLPVESRHSFTYPTISLLVSVNALEAHKLDIRGGWIFGYGGIWGRLIGLRSNGYLIEQGISNRGLKDKLAQVLQDRGYDGAQLDDAWMMTMPSFLGFEGINPLTVFFCYKPGGEFWLTVFEIHNTFGEAHVHIMENGVNEDNILPTGFDHQWTFPRSFHVSPFNDRSGTYTISIKSPSHAPFFAKVSCSETTPPRPAVRIHLHSDAPKFSADSSATLKIGPLKLTALLRPTVATALTGSSLFSTLSRYPFTLLLALPRIMYQAGILHYRKRLDVFIRPEPLPVPGADVRTAGGIHWQPEGLLERFARRRVETFLKHQVEVTGVTVSLVAGNPEIPPRTFTPLKSSTSEYLIIHYLSSRFFTIVFQSPSGAYAHLLGCTTERIFTTSSTHLFLRVFAPHTNDTQQALPPTLLVSSVNTTQRLRIHNIPTSLLTSSALPVSPIHPLDSSSKMTFHNLTNIVALCILVLLESSEKWVFSLAQARIVPGDEPWEAWNRAEQVTRNGNAIKDSGDYGSVRRA